MAIEIPATNSFVLRTKMGLARGVLHAATDRLWRHPDLRGLFLAYLVLAHQIVRASVPLMETALRRLMEHAESEPVWTELCRYLTAHIEEERDHDAWILDDLEAAGVRRGMVLARTPPATVASMVGAQYYWIRHHHPIALLGYIAVLEGYSPPASHAAVLPEVTSLPTATFRTYDLHVRDDPDHLAGLYRTLDSLPLKAPENVLIGLSALHTIRLLADCLDTLAPIEVGQSHRGGSGRS